MEIKKCSKCGKELPMTSEYFYKQKTSKCGFRSQCKKCCDIQTYKYIGEHKESIKTKRHEYDETHKEQRQERENSEKYKETRKSYYKNNKERILKRAAEWRENNKEKVKELKKNDYKKYREKIIKKVGEWQKNNKEKANAKVSRYQKTEKGIKTRELKRARYKNKVKSSPNTLTAEQWELIKQHFNNVCAYCGQAKKLEHDHVIPVSKSGELTQNNIVPSCKSCNASKGNKDLKTWYKQQPFYSSEREKAILDFLGYNEDKQQLKLI